MCLSLRITFILPYAGLAGGVKVVAIYADRLRSRGHHVTIVSIPLRKVSFFDQMKDIIRRRVVRKRNTTHGPSHLDALGLDWRVINKKRPIIDQDVPDGDIIIATWWETAEWVYELSSAKGTKAFFIQHHEVHDNQPKDRVVATWKLPLHKITISKWLSDVSEVEYGKGPVPIIHNSVDMEQFNAPTRSINHPPCVGLLYSNTYWKGIPVSFEAIEYARKIFPDLRVILFGSHQESDAQPLPKNATLTVKPAQEDIRNIYGSCDFWLCGSYAEGFHLPPLEAMACGVPVVSTRVGGPMDIIREGENGYLSPVGDAEALGANLVKALRCTPEEWQRMSAAALKTATDYTWEDATDLFEAELYRIVKAGPLQD